MQFTVRVSLVIALGPLDEKKATEGANSFFSAIVFSIVPLGLLFIIKNEWKPSSTRIRIYFFVQRIHSFIQIDLQ